VTIRAGRNDGDTDRFGRIAVAHGQSCAYRHATAVSPKQAVKLLTVRPGNRGRLEAAGMPASVFTTPGKRITRCTRANGRTEWLFGLMLSDLGVQRLAVAVLQQTFSGPVGPIGRRASECQSIHRRRRLRGVVLLGWLEFSRGSRTARARRAECPMCGAGTISAVRLDAAINSARFCSRAPRFIEVFAPLHERPSAAPIFRNGPGRSATACCNTASASRCAPSSFSIRMRARCARKSD
jgi:hypothetical protein